MSAEYISGAVFFAGVATGDLSTSINSDPIKIEFQNILSIQAIYTGSPTGQLLVQGSLDLTNWITFPLVTKTIDAAGTHIWDFPTTAIPYFRISYSRTIGTGTLQLLIHHKRYSRG